MEGGVSPLVKMFEEAEDATIDARKQSERDRDYYDNKQWTAAEARKIEKRGQPVVTYNRIARKIDYLSGLEKQQRKDPKAFPRTPDDQDAADAATDGIRFVCDDEEWDDKRSEAWDNILIEGTCAILVGHKEGKQGIDPALFHIPWDRFFYDPHSSRPDFSDARYMGIVTWYDAEEAKERWPDAAELFDQTLADAKASETYDDKPKSHLWGDFARKRVRVIEGYYLKNRQWHRCVATRTGEIEQSAPSPYLDEEGRPENPIKAMSLYVDRDNNRYGAVRVMISPQDEINKRRSKGLHLITMRQARVSQASGEDKEKIRRELAKPDGVISAEKDEFEILPTADMARGNFEMLQEAKAEIDLLGANAALAGKNENDLSGRAILAQQQGGMVEVARMFDRLRSLSIEVYRSVWNRIRQFWQDERWVRITDDENNLKFVGLNQKVTVRMLAQEVMQGDEKALAKAAELVGPELLQAAMAGDERANTILGMFVQQNGDQVVEVRNAINELDVDIVIDEGMDTPSVQAEQFDQLIKMVPGIPALANSPQAMEMLIEASALRNKHRLIEILQQGPSPEQVAAQQKQEAIMEAGAIAEVEKTQSETAKNLAQAQTAGSVAPSDPVEQAFRSQELEIDGYRAETERIEAVKPQRPEAA